MRPDRSAGPGRANIGPGRPQRVSRLLALTRRLARDRRGAIAVIFAILFPVLAGILGLGIETGIWYIIKRQDQTVADIAAYSGALEIAAVIGGSTSLTSDQITQVKNTAKADAKTNGFDFAKNTASTVDVSGTTVTVTLKHDQTPMMVSYFLGKNTFQIANQAAASVTSFPSCASSVGSSGTGLSLSGNTSLSIPGCTITSNSTAEGKPANVYSIEVGGGSSISGAGIYTAGGINSGPNSTLPSVLTTNAKPLVDPYCKTPMTDCMRVPNSVTGFVMPTLPTSLINADGTSFFPTVAAVQAAPPNTNFAAAPSLSVSNVQPSGNGACDPTVTPGQTVSNLNKSCYLNPNGVTITGSSFAANKSPYYFVGPVTITGSVTMAASVDIYVASGSFTVANGGSLIVASNGGKPNGSKAGDNIWILTGTFDASAGTVTFNNASGGDTTNTSAYAIQAPGGVKFGNATLNSGEYAFYGAGGLTIGGASAATRTALGPANYYVDAGGVTVSSGLFAGFTASVTNPGTANATNLTIHGGNFTSNGTLTFNNAGTSGVTYSLQVPSGGNYTVSAGSATFGANTKFGLYGGALTTSSATNVAFNTGVNFYLNTGSLALNGCASIGGTPSGLTTAGTSTINLGSGSLTVASTGTPTFAPSGTVCEVSYTSADSQYNIKTGGSGNVALSGPATFNAGTYYFMNSLASSGTGVAVSAGNPTFAGGIYSVQNGSFSVANGATASFTAGTPCAPTVGSPPAGSCVYLANGGFSNAGTAKFATGNYYLYDPNGSGTSFTNTGTMTLGTTASSNFHISNTGGAFSNAAGATLNFGAGNYYISDGTSASGQNSGGFASSGILNFTGGNSSQYFFINGPSFGTGSSSGTCVSGNSNTIFGALSIMGGSTANLGPANYYLLNGDLCMNQDKGTAPILGCTLCTGGKGITFILTGNGGNGGYPSDVSTLQIPDAITSTLTAPNGTPDGTTGVACVSPYNLAGCYTGVLFFQDPDRDALGVARTPAGAISGNSCSNSSNCSLLEGGANMALAGAAYIPQSVVDFSSNNVANTCLVVIAQAILFTGSSDFLSAQTCGSNVRTLTSSTVAWIE